MRLRIWHKMIIGISIPSFIMLMGSLITYKYIDDIDIKQGSVQIADDLREELLEIRRNEKNFMHFKDARHLDNLYKEISVLNFSLQKISPETVEDIGKEDFSVLDNTIQKYPGLVSDLYASYEQETKIMEMVREEGRNLEALVSGENYSGDLTTSFVLHLRLLEKNYMLFRDKESFLKLSEGVSGLSNMVPLCQECKPYIGATRDLFAAYKKSDALVNEIQLAGNRLEEITGKMAINQRQRISTFLKKTKYLLIAAVVLLCIIGPLFVYKTATYIVAPIKRLSEITRKISEGNMTLRAPIREHDETYSLALSFNTMLDKLQLTYQSLEKSMELLSEKQAQLVDSEKRASMGLLVSGVAHELNNPLYNISLTVDAMREELKDLTPQNISEYIDDIAKQSKRAHDIIDNLLDFARARKSTEMKKYDIVSIVKESFDLVINHLRINNIALKQDLPDAPVFIRGNHSKLEQVLVSIYTNAIQAMKKNGRLSVSVGTDAENKNVLVKISDSGPGIQQEDIKNIFEPFFTTKPVGQGTGLGLSVCRSLVQEHNGEIEVESKIGEGTTFTIKFPLYKETARV